jgi:hypothetical protein
MRIKQIEVILTWEDGTVNEVSNYLPAQTFSNLEQFADYWEEKYNDDVEECYDEEQA